MTINIAVSDGCAEDFHGYAECFAQNQSAKSLSELRWRYSQGPTTNSLITLAKDESECPARVAAVYAAMSVPFFVGGQSVVAAQSLDTMTDARYRGRGLFVQLADVTYRSLQQQGVSLVYGFPNGSSAPGFFSKLQWARLDPVPFLIKPLSIGYFVRQALGGAKLSNSVGRLIDFPLSAVRADERPSIRVERLTEFGTSYDALWQSLRPLLGVGVDRNAQYMNWRLFQHPTARYEVRGVVEHGALKGIVAWRLENKHGGRVGYVIELLTHPDSPGVARALLRAAVGKMRSDGAEVVLSWCPSHHWGYSAFRRMGFYVLPEQLRPIELHWGVRALAREVLPIVQERSRWYLSYVDSDTV